VSASLHTDPLKLPRSDLSERVRNALQQVVDAQTSTSGQWQRTDGGAQYMELLRGVRFVPDGSDGQRGLLNMILGVVGAILGAVVLFDASDQPTVALGCAIFVGGGYLFTRGRRMSKQAQARPRESGIYLFDDMLVQVTRLGCRRFPKANIERFEFARTGPRAQRLELLYRTDDGELDQLELMRGRDVLAMLEAWRER
jgi:hypothetical protein